MKTFKFILQPLGLVGLLLCATPSRIMADSCIVPNFSWSLGTADILRCGTPGLLNSNTYYGIREKRTWAYLDPISTNIGAGATFSHYLFEGNLDRAHGDQHMYLRELLLK